MDESEILVNHEVVLCIMSKMKYMEYTSLKTLKTDLEICFVEHI